MPSMEQTLKRSQNPYTVGVEVHTGLKSVYGPIQEMLEHMMTEIKLIWSEQKRIEQKINHETEKVHRRFYLQCMDLRDQCRDMEQRLDKLESAASK